MVGTRLWLWIRVPAWCIRGAERLWDSRVVGDAEREEKGGQFPSSLARVLAVLYRLAQACKLSLVATPSSVVASVDRSRISTAMDEPTIPRAVLQCPLLHLKRKA